MTGARTASAAAGRPQVPPTRPAAHPAASPDGRHISPDGRHAGTGSPDTDPTTTGTEPLNTDPATTGTEPLNGTPAPRRPAVAEATPLRPGEAVPVPTPAPPRPAPAPVPLPDSAAAQDVPQVLAGHGCWYPSTDPGGRNVAFICDRAGVPHLWAGPVDGDGVHLLDADPDPVIEVSWSPDGRWIAYTTAPGGGELTRVLCVRPDGTGRRLLAGGEPGSSAHLGCWQHDGSMLAVTVAEPAPYAGAAAPDLAFEASRAPGWAARDGRAVLLPRAAATAPAPRVAPAGGAVGGPPGGDEPAPRTLAAYLVDPEGAVAPVLLASERGAATLRVCDLSRDGRLALLRRGPRGRREALVVRTRDLRATCEVPVADGDPWIGGFSPDGRTLWLRSDGGREYAALTAVRLDPHGRCAGVTAVAERPDSELELLALNHDGQGAVLVWNVRGVSELEVVELSAPGADTAETATPGADAAGTATPGTGAAGTATPGTGAPGADAASAGPAALLSRRAVPLPHEVVTRAVPAAASGGPVVALSGSRRRPGVWWLPQGAALRTPWSSRDEDATPDGRPPVRPVPMRPVARDGLVLGGWYYRAPGRVPGEPAPCVIHLHGGPEEQERPVFNPLYHELLGRGLDVFAPDVRGSSGYGRSFVDADLGERRFAAIDDVAACAAHAVLAGPADPRRLAVMGRSYGGYLTMASLVWHPDLFRTGVAVCGMSDLTTFFAGTEPWIGQSAAHKYGHPERDRELLRALSPMSRIDALRVPVLAVHGEHDTNVPPGESEQFVRAARERGLEAELLVLREEGHDFRRADNRRLFRRAAADWIERHLGG
ncbi:peptidase S9 [Streptomyces echinoruber]|uniref:Peptidase S9 n=1 Tax=Streptomyces echinoruber TaxID=68898 RepID=A0A918VDW5_9ACTN|nr:peptidase S9 [Streptomyces echinoruber]